MSGFIAFTPVCGDSCGGLHFAGCDCWETKRDAEIARLWRLAWAAGWAAVGMAVVARAVRDDLDEALGYVSVWFVEKWDLDRGVRLLAMIDAAHGKET